MPGHSDWAKPIMGLREGYAITGAAEKRRQRAMPLRLTQRYAGTEERLCNNCGAGEAATECHATQIEPNLSWGSGKAMQ